MQYICFFFFHFYVSGSQLMFLRSVASYGTEKCLIAGRDGVLKDKHSPCGPADAYAYSRVVGDAGNHSFKS